MKHERRGSWYLLTGLVLGVAMGLFYSWVISPVKYVDAPPYALRADYREEYRALVAAAFMYSNDLLRAQDRLKELKDDNPAQSIAMQAQRALADGRPEAEIRALSLLATALAKNTIPSASTPASPIQATSNPAAAQQETTPSNPMSQITIPTSTSLPLPTSISPPNSGTPFILQDSKLVCNTDQPDPLIQVEVKDADGQPTPGVELVVTWEQGEDHFFTGLQPELGVGYGDFLMTPNVVYSVHLADGSQEANDLTATECVAEDGSRYWGSWLLTFIQP
jgi:hypothetical protein